MVAMRVNPMMLIGCKVEDKTLNMNAGNKLIIRNCVQQGLLTFQGSMLPVRCYQALPHFLH